MTDFASKTRVTLATGTIVCGFLNWRTFAGIHVRRNGRLISSPWRSVGHFFEPLAFLSVLPVDKFPRINRNHSSRRGSRSIMRWPFQPDSVRHCLQRPVALLLVGLCLTLVSLGGSIAFSSFALLGTAANAEELGTDGEVLEVSQHRARPKLCAESVVTSAPLAARSVTLYRAASTWLAPQPQTAVHLIGAGIRILC